MVVPLVSKPDSTSLHDQHGTGNAGKWWLSATESGATISYDDSRRFPAIRKLGSITMSKQQRKFEKSKK